MSMNESLDAYLSVRLMQAYVRTYPDSLADLKNGFANGYKAGLADSELLEALREIAEGCMNLRPGHVDAGKNRTKAEIENIARAAIAKATGEAA